MPEEDLTPAERAAMTLPEEFVETDDDGEVEAEDADDGAEEIAAAEPEEPEAEADPISTLVPAWRAPENADQQIEALAAQAGGLAEQFDAGQLSAAEFHRSLAEVNSQRAELTKQIDRAQLGDEMRLTRWVNGDVESFLKKHSELRGYRRCYGAIRRAPRQDFGDERACRVCDACKLCHLPEGRAAGGQYG